MTVSKSLFKQATSCMEQECVILASSFQAGNTEGGEMYLRFARSFDLDLSLEPSAKVVPCTNESSMGPVLHYNDSSSVLSLFYARSRNHIADFRCFPLL